MSATSKLVGFSTTTRGDTDEVGQRVDVERRRYLMRYVVGALVVAGLICVAAGVRVAMSRSAAPQDDIAAPLAIRPFVLSPPPAAPPAQAEPPAVITGAPVAAPPIAAAPTAETPAAGQPGAAASGVAAQAAAKPIAAATSAPGTRARAAARPQGHASAIIQSAPF